MEWFVYIIISDDNTLSTGITTDIDRRFTEHSGNRSGAKYFNGRKPRKVLYREGGHDRSSALKREWTIKQLTRAQKIEMVEQWQAQSG